MSTPSEPDPSAGRSGPSPDLSGATGPHEPAGEFGGVSPAQPAPGQDGYDAAGQAAPGPPPYLGPGLAVQPLPPDQERTWAMLAHLLSFAAAYVALGLVAPLIVLLVYGKRSEFVRRHATESLNFNITTLIVVLVSVPLLLVLVGFFILGAWVVYYVVAIILASVRASNGQPYRYPVNIRFVR